MTELPDGYWIDERTGERRSYPWPLDHNEKRHLIKNSLGPLIIRWIEESLTEAEFEVHGPGLLDPFSGRWLLTDEEKRAVILFYAYNPDNGEFIYRDAKPDLGIARRTPVIDVIEKYGPSQLAWDDNLGWHGVKNGK